VTNLDRQANLRRLEAEEFDLLIIGGGITGACLAFDAATRGIKTALIEKSDFGHATSAASSKLLHGGIRFLQQLRFDKVRESAFERVYFQNLAPHLCRYVPFLVPTFPGLKSGRTFLAAGAAVYSAVSFGQNRKARHAQSRVPPPKLIGRDEVVSRVPWLGSDWPGTGALVLPECHMKNSEDGSTFEIRASAVANCAGPWLGKIDAAAVGEARSPISSFFRGAHLVLQNLELECAVALPTPQKIQGIAGRGGRHVFLIPWRDHVLLGTSYAPHEETLDRVMPTETDIQQLLEAVNIGLGSRLLTPDHIAHAFAGIYPITATDVKKEEYQGASDYFVTDHGKARGPRGYFSVFGAKFTTARKLAELACDAIAEQMDRSVGRCITRNSTIDIGDIDDPDAYQESIAKRHGSSLEASSVRYLYDNFGRDVENILEIAAGDPRLFEHIADDREDIAAEAIYCARDEMIVHLEDFVFRRTGMGTIGNPGKEAVMRCAELIGAELQWSAERINEEVAATFAKFPVLVGQVR
jgi:glycerol-3-phosphate dehydrogenase